VSIVDSAMTRDVLRDISKRPVDISQLNVHVIHGIVYLQGRLERLRGYYEDLNIEEELHIIIRLLKQKPGVRDVCCEIQITGSEVIERVKENKRQANY